MSGKDCGNHGDDDMRKSCKKLLAILLIMALTAGTITLIVFLVLRPTRPRFYLKDATLRQLAVSNVSGRLSSVIQVTIAARNPNGRVGIFYDRLDSYATYKFQQVTLAAPLTTPVFQPSGGVDVWSPVLLGPGVPFAPMLRRALAEDFQAGWVMLQVKIDGRIRWKVGTWISGRYHLFVSCPAFFVTRGGIGMLGANGFRFFTPTVCRVEV